MTESPAPTASGSDWVMPADYVARAKELELDLPADGLVQKKVFAALEGVSGAAVSKWVRLPNPIIDGKALEGSGRSARIFLPEAYAQLRARSNINQTATQRQTDAAKAMAFVGEYESPLDGAAEPSLPLETGADGTAPSDGEDQKKSSNLKALEDAKLRKAKAEAEITEAKAQQQIGRWIDIDEHNRAVTIIVKELVTVLENVPRTLGEALASQFDGLDGQAIIVACEEATREIRTKFAERMANRAADIERKL